MLCAKGHSIPDNVLACPVCAAKRGEQAFHDLQVEFLRKVVRGEYSYALRIAKVREHHVMMYSSQTRTFCGRHLETPQIRYEPYADDMFHSLCPDCRNVITSLIEEAKES
jgi:hypothetical protein